MGHPDGQIAGKPTAKQLGGLPKSNTRMVRQTPGTHDPNCPPLEKQGRSRKGGLPEGKTECRAPKRHRNAALPGRRGRWTEGCPDSSCRYFARLPDGRTAAQTRRPEKQATRLKEHTACRQTDIRISQLRGGSRAAGNTQTPPPETDERKCSNAGN